MQIVEKSKWYLKISLLKSTGHHRTALASFPRSGNTWLRALIENSTGEKSGSIYHDRIMTRKSEGVVIKTHALDSYRYTRAIHVIRYPFDAIESYFRWKLEIANQSIEWSDHVFSCINEWKVHSEYWLNQKIPIYRIRYEDLLSDTELEMAKILDWLEYDMTLSEIRKSVERSSLPRLRKKNPDLGKHFFRSGRAGNGILCFDDSQIRFLETSLSHLLEEFNYSKSVD
jgi:hypothetical protein